MCIPLPKCRSCEETKLFKNAHSGQSVNSVRTMADYALRREGCLAQSWDANSSESFTWRFRFIASSDSPTGARRIKHPGALRATPPRETLPFDPYQFAK